MVHAELREDQRYMLEMGSAAQSVIHKAPSSPHLPDPGMIFQSDLPSPIPTVPLVPDSHHTSISEPAQIFDYLQSASTHQELWRFHMDDFVKANKTLLENAGNSQLQTQIQIGYKEAEVKELKDKSRELNKKMTTMKASLNKSRIMATNFKHRLVELGESPSDIKALGLPTRQQQSKLVGGWATCPACDYDPDEQNSFGEYSGAKRKRVYGEDIPSDQFYDRRAGEERMVIYREVDQPQNGTRGEGVPYCEEGGQDQSGYLEEVPCNEDEELYQSENAVDELPCNEGEEQNQDGNVEEELPYSEGGEQNQDGNVEEEPPCHEGGGEEDLEETVEDMLNHETSGVYSNGQISICFGQEMILDGIILIEDEELSSAGPSREDTGEGIDGGDTEMSASPQPMGAEPVNEEVRLPLIKEAREMRKKSVKIETGPVSIPPLDGEQADAQVNTPPEVEESEMVDGSPETEEMDDDDSCWPDPLSVKVERTIVKECGSGLSRSCGFNRRPCKMHLSLSPRVSLNRIKVPEQISAADGE